MGIVIGHNLDGLDRVTQHFFAIVDDFRAKRHDLLDYHNNKFDRDYVEFNLQVHELENRLQSFINESFENITSIEQSLALLHKFQSILQRDNLRQELENKFTVIFHNYGIELSKVQVS